MASISEKYSREKETGHLLSFTRAFLHCDRLIWLSQLEIADNAFLHISRKKTALVPTQKTTKASGFAIKSSAISGSRLWISAEFSEMQMMAAEHQRVSDEDEDEGRQAQAESVRPQRMRGQGLMCSIVMVALAECLGIMSLAGGILASTSLGWTAVKNKAKSDSGLSGNCEVEAVNTRYVTADTICETCSFAGYIAGTSLCNKLITAASITSMSFLMALSWTVWIATCDMVAEGYYDALSKEDPRFHLTRDQIGWGVILSIMSTVVGIMASIIECLTILAATYKLQRCVPQRQGQSSLENGGVEIEEIRSFSDAIQGTSTVY
eukprot:jgi/Bigna1/88022/estExt_fgenesh1_pg.C_270083